MNSTARSKDPTQAIEGGNTGNLGEDGATDNPLVFSGSVVRHAGAAGTRGFAVAPARQLHSHQPSDDGPHILIAHDLTPADTSALDLTQVSAFCTAVGGPTSHAVQVAYSLGIPTIVAAGDRILTIPDGMMCALDGDTGTLYSELMESDLAAAMAHRDRRTTRPRAQMSGGSTPVTLTGTITRPPQAAEVRAAGADGLGLLATELLFLGREQDLTDEEQHYAAYREIARAVGGAPVTLRTLDIGGDKDMPALGLPSEDNPFLGVRGLRLSLRRPDLFLPQLRAAYRVARDDGAQLRLMFPMVTRVEEFLQAAETAREVQAELDAPVLPLGVMVEVPACALAVDQFAGHVDFLSIGTNDLAQYLTAMSRTSADLARDIDPLHVAVTRTVRAVAETGADHGIPVSACGGLAGDPVGAVVLAALGVTALTVALPYLPDVHDALGRTDAAALATIRDHALSTGGSRHLRALATELLGL
ncbi:phosphoenolpyruvate--protein phosphotransferase [Kitasatospora aureofaciens]|uniref:putative PEP-binding protein n=1 Tax=Kitasatospora aureofaciens TaxID=1894 RepID=UPI001C43B1DD|nr:putative PEP-binding protein [Kitasatospora aureofaciens]MBV6695703.1 phosphoenolpyruvate--protein phosphotransferase [Kitasatospora aureofaciens]